MSMRLAGNASRHIMGIRPNGWLFQILILIALTLIIIWVIKDSKKKESATDILKKRYASGEISQSEFKKIKKDIE